MLYPKIENCVVAVKCKYTLATIVFKRAKELTRVKPAEFVNSASKEITYALNEVLMGKIVPNVGGAGAAAQ